MTEQPNQKEFWDAYGHALGAAAGLELTMRIALIHAAALKGPLAAEGQAAEVDRIRGMTLGVTARSFLIDYPEFTTDEAFVSGLCSGTAFRNHLAHNFLDGRLDAFRSDDGIKLIALECMLATEHFRELERVVRAKCSADFEAFFAQGEARGDEFINSHPLRMHLSEIKSGNVPAGRGLEWWELDKEITSELGPSAPGT